MPVPILKVWGDTAVFERNTRVLLHATVMNAWKGTSQRVKISGTYWNIDTVFGQDFTYDTVDIEQCQPENVVLDQWQEATFDLPVSLPDYNIYLMVKSWHYVAEKGYEKDESVIVRFIDGKVSYPDADKPTVPPVIIPPPPVPSPVSTPSKNANIMIRVVNIPANFEGYECQAVSTSEVGILTYSTKLVVAGARTKDGNMYDAFVPGKMHVVAWSPSDSQFGKQASYSSLVEGGKYQIDFNTGVMSKVTDGQAQVPGQIPGAKPADGFSAFISKLIPMPYSEGPPLPRIFGIQWPWYKGKYV